MDDDQDRASLADALADSDEDFDSSSDTGNTQDAATGDIQNHDADDGADSTDWKAEAEKYRQQAEENERRYKGLQPVTQKAVEDSRAYQAQLLELQQRAAQQQISMLPEDQQQVAWAQYQLAVQQNRLNQERQELESQRSNAQQYALSAYARELSQQHGVPLNELLGLPDATMINLAYHARKLGEERRAQRKQQRKQNRQDPHGGGGGAVSRPPKKPETLQEVRAALKKNFRWQVTED